MNQFSNGHYALSRGQQTNNKNRNGNRKTEKISTLATETTRAELFLLLFSVANVLNSVFGVFHSSALQRWSIYVFINPIRIRLLIGILFEFSSDPNDKHNYKQKSRIPNNRHTNKSKNVNSKFTEVSGILALSLWIEPKDFGLLISDNNNYNLNCDLLSL